MNIDVEDGKTFPSASGCHLFSEKKQPLVTFVTVALTGRLLNRGITLQERRVEIFFCVCRVRGFDKDDDL